jgi:hypothetical protein
MTRDLDCFGPSHVHVNRVVPAAENALKAAGFSVRRILEGKSFVRLEVIGEKDVTEVDFGADFRLLPAERGPLGMVLAGEELAINKVLAVFGRAEARDFVDLAAFEERYGLLQLCRRAMDKDPGFDPQIFRDMVRSFARLPEMNSNYPMKVTSSSSEPSIDGRSFCSI